MTAPRPMRTLSPVRIRPVAVALAVLLLPAVRAWAGG